MQTSRDIRLLFLVTFALLGRVRCQTPITCTAGYYKAGQKATITCHYHGVISTNQNTGVYITRRQLQDSQDSSGTEVLMCHFSGGSVSVCDPEDGYRFINFDKNNLTIEVPDVSADFQGRYSCGVVPATGRAVIPCLLVVAETQEPMKAPPEKPERLESLHNDVKTIRGLVVFIVFIIIMAAITGVAIVLLLAYRNKWGPFRTTAKPQKADEEKGVQPDNLDSDDRRPIVQETVTNPTYESRVDASAPPPVSPEKERLLKEEKDEARGSASRDEAAARGGRALETKPETEDERRDRENRENAEKAEEEIRKAQENMDDLQQRLKSAPKNEHKGIKMEIGQSENRLKQLKKTEEERRKQLEKAEKERKKKEEKEQKEREKAEKGKKK